MQIRKPIISGGVGKPKRSPLHIPDVLYANNSLYFDDSQIGCMFEIYDESENVTLRKCRSKRYENFPHVKCLQQMRKNRIIF